MREIFSYMHICAYCMLYKILIIKTLYIYISLRRKLFLFLQIRNLREKLIELPGLVKKKNFGEVASNPDFKDFCLKSYTLYHKIISICSSENTLFSVTIQFYVPLTPIISYWRLLQVLTNAGFSPLYRMGSCNFLLLSIKH